MNTQNTNTQTDRIQAGIAGYCAKLQEARNKTYGPTFPENCKETVDVVTGKKYAKVCFKSANTRSAVAFIDLNTGDIFKAASFSAPAKGIRGNVLSEKSGFENSNAYGPNYLYR